MRLFRGCGYEGVVMKSVSRQAFTLFELMVTVALIGIVSSLAFRGAYTFLQEQHLRQAANEFVSYLLTARARALREGSLSGKACELQLIATTLKPTTHSQNLCHDSPSLDLLAVSGGDGLTITSMPESSLMTFTRLGTIASSNLSNSGNVALPRTFYFSNGATQVQRCVMVDLNSLRIGWRNSPSTEFCTYNGY